MAKKPENDRTEVLATYTTYCEVLAEAVLKLTGAWDSFRLFDEDPTRVLSEREAVHLRSALFMTKELHDTLCSIAIDYNLSLGTGKNVLKIFPGAVDIHDRTKQPIK